MSLRSQSDRRRQGQHHYRTAGPRPRQPVADNRISGENEHRRAIGVEHFDGLAGRALLVAD
jgi:hypothetical protein